VHRTGDLISTKRTLVRNTLANTAAQFTQMASAFVFMPFLIARFGLDDYGLFLLAGSLSGYLGLLDLGVGASLVKFISAHRARSEQDELSGTISTALIFYSAIGVVAALLMTGVAMFGIQFFKLPATSEHLARNLFLLGAATSLFTWPASTATHVLAGHQRYDITARISMTVTVGNILATATILAIGQGPLALLAATSLVGIVGSMVAIVYARRQITDISVKPSQASMQSLREIFRFSIVVFITQLCSVLIYAQTDRLVLGVFAGTAAIALYEGAQKLHSLVRQLASLVNSAVIPTASQLDAENRQDALFALFIRGTKYTVILVTPVVVALMILAQPILSNWLGEEYAAVATAAQLYLSYWLLNANVTIAGAILMGTDRMRFLLWYTVGGAVLNVVLSIILVQQLGVTGVVLGTVLPAYIGFPVYMAIIAKVLKFPLAAWLRQVVIPTYPWLLVTALIATVGLQSSLADSLVGVLALVAASVGVYWCCIAVFGLSRAERDDIRGFVSSYRSR